MGSNFHTIWDTSVLFKPSTMNPALAGLDKAITKLKNLIVHCAGTITYNKVTGKLKWSGILWFYFPKDDDGKVVSNKVVAGEVTLADNQMAYVDLSDTNDTTITVSVATITLGTSVTTIPYNRVVLGYRNTTSDEFYPVCLVNVQEEAVTDVSAAEVTVDWDKGHFQQVIIEQDVEFTFSGGQDGDQLILRIKQDDTGGWNPIWPATIRYGDTIVSIVLSQDPDVTDYLCFIYDANEGVYDLLWHETGFIVAS